METAIKSLPNLMGNKKRGKLIIIAALLLILVPTLSLAVPNLQIYIPGATYVNETWVINSYDYKLWVIGANLPIYDVKFAAAVPYDGNGSNGSNGSIDVTWVQGERTGDPTDTLDEDTDYFTKGPATPTMGDGTELPPHGVFPTSYYEYFIGDFCFGMTKDNKEDYETVYDYVPPDPEDEYEEMTDEYGNPAYGWGYGEIKKFDISVSVPGYTWVDIVAYDHYIQANEKIHCIFTPFSHDGASAIPEPATMLLLGSGLIGLGWIGRKKAKKGSRA